MTRKLLYAFALSAILGAALAPPSSAGQLALGRSQGISNGQTDWASPEEFRAQYLKFIDTLAARIPASDQSAWAVGMRQKVQDLRQQVSTLSSPSLEHLSAAYNRQEFNSMVLRLRAGSRDTRRTRDTAAHPTGTSQAPDVPGPLGPINPPDFSGAVSGTTCSSTPTSAGTLDGEKIGLYVDKGAQVPLDYACETIVEVLGEGTNAPFCVAAAIAKAIEVVLDSLINHQEFCNSLLDGATAEATLNDVVDIHGDVDALDAHLTTVNNQINSEITAVDNHLSSVSNQISAGFTGLDTHLTNIDNHISDEFTALDAHIVNLFGQLSTQLMNTTKLLSADLKQVMKLELTPDGRRQIVPAILTCSGSDCPDVLTQCTGPGGSCSWNNVGPLP